MSVQRFTAKASEVQQVADKYIYLSFELLQPHRLSFIAGQHILLETPGTEQKKSYSIASDPSTNHKIELLVDVSPGGLGTRYLSSIKPGDEIAFYAPSGRFTILQPDTDLGRDEQALVFVATGSGITPIRSMVLDQLHQKEDKRKIILYWGLRNENMMFWQEDFLLLSETYKNFSFHPVLSQASDEWPLCRGRVTDCLSIHPFLENAGYYLCGNHEMIEHVQELLLGKGVRKEHIHSEEFYA